MRYAPQLPLPAQPYRPGHGLPRPRLPLPVRQGGAAKGLATAEELGATDLTAFRYAVDLYNVGCWWEAHEAWEGVWTRSRRGSPLFRLLQGLIMLAAARLKARDGRPGGQQRLAARAEEHLRAAEAADPAAGPLGLAIAPLIAACTALKEHTPATPALPTPPPIRLRACD